MTHTHAASPVWAWKWDGALVWGRPHSAVRLPAAWAGPLSPCQRSQPSAVHRGRERSIPEPARAPCSQQPARPGEGSPAAAAPARPQPTRETSLRNRTLISSSRLLQSHDEGPEATASPIPHPLTEPGSLPTPLPHRGGGGVRAQGRGREQGPPSPPAAVELTTVAGAALHLQLTRAARGVAGDLHAERPCPSGQGCHPGSHDRPQRTGQSGSSSC